MQILHCMHLTDSKGKRDDLGFFKFCKNFFYSNQKNLDILKAMCGGKLTKKHAENFFVQAIILGDKFIIKDKFVQIPFYEEN